MPKGYYPLALDNYTATFKPMPVPDLATIQDAPLVCVQFSEKLIPYLLGLLEEYRWPDKLKGTPQEVQHALSLFEDLRYALMIAVDDCEKGEVCRDYAPNHEIISYAPQDPFTQPDYIPPGYKEPPFKKVTDPIAALFLGLQLGDVMTGLLGLPVETPAVGQGLARFRVSLTGAGTVELHLITMPLGGTAVIITDDNPLTTQWIPLIRQGNLLPPENNIVNIVEIEVKGAGAHHVDCTFIPSFKQTITFIGYGGGLRKVNLCGFEPMQGRKQPLLIRQKPTDNCVLQQSLDGGTQWTDVFSARQCAVDTVKDMIGRGEIPGGANPEPAQCFDLDLTVLANSSRLIPLAITSGWTLRFTDVKGAWNDGNIGHDWVCPDGHWFLFGGCSPQVEGTQSGDPIPTIPHMKLILRLPDGTYAAIPLDGTPYVVPQGQPEGNTFLLANDSVLADNQGSVSLHLLACNTELKCYIWDFSLSDCGFAAGGYMAFGPDSDGRVMGQYGAAAWETTDNYSPTFNYSDRAVSIHRSFDSLLAFKIEVVYDYTAGTSPFGVKLFVAPNIELAGTTQQGADQVLVWNGVATIDKIGAQVWPTGNSGNSFSGAGKIKAIRIYSTDPAPSGASEC